MLDQRAGWFFLVPSSFHYHFWTVGHFYYCLCAHIRQIDKRAAHSETSALISQTRGDTYIINQSSNHGGSGLNPTHGPLSQVLPFLSEFWLSLSELSKEMVEMKSVEPSGIHLLFCVFNFESFRLVLNNKFHFFFVEGVHSTVCVVIHFCSACLVSFMNLQSAGVQ